MTEYRQRMKRREEDKGREKRERVAWQKKEERDEGETLLSFRCTGWWVHLAWAVASAVWRHTTGTNGRFMILYQLSAVSHTWQPPTRNGIITSRPPVSQMSSEERSRETLHSWWRRIPRIFLTWSSLCLLHALRCFPQERRKHNTQTQLWLTFVWKTKGEASDGPLEV